MSNAQKLSQAVAGGTNQFVAPSGALGTPSSGTLTNCTADGTNAVGTKNVPATSFTSGTLTTAERGKYSAITGATTIPDNVFAAGDVVRLYNNTSGTITITCTITTAYIAGTDSDKATMTLAARGLATILFTSATACVVQGNVS